MCLNRYKIPSFISKCLDKILPVSDNSYLKGDYEEIYRSICREKNSYKANIWITGQIIKSSISYLADSLKWDTLMYKNYLKTAIRSISRNKTTSFINIFGLSIGIAFSLLAFLFVDHEYSFDKFHSDPDSIFRVWTDSYNPRMGTMKANAVPYQLTLDFRDLFPEVEFITNVANQEMIINKDGLIFREMVSFVDSEFFKIFSFPILQGNTANPVINRNSVVISSEVAGKYFENEDPVGKILKVTIQDYSKEYIVSAVIDNCKEISTLHFNFLISFEEFKSRLNPQFLRGYGAWISSMYIKLIPGTNVEELREKIHHIDDQIDQNLRPGRTRRYNLMNIKEIHIETELDLKTDNVSNPLYSYIFLGLGGIVLTIACINFMILSTGLSAKRVKEVGVRKVMGAYRSSLIRQFLGEAIIMSLIALISGIIISILFLPVFNDLTGKNLEFVLSLKFLIIMLAGTLIVGFIAGSYPAIYQSNFKPVIVLKRSSGGSKKSIFIRFLVIIQFSLSIVLIIVMVVFRQQLIFLQEKNLGFNHEKVIEINMNTNPANADQILERYRNEIVNDRRIISVSGSSSSYGSGIRGNLTQLGFEQSDGERIFINYSIIDQEYFNTMGIEVIEGRNFSKEFGTDPEIALIINEKAVEVNGLNYPIGKKPEWIGPGSQKIIGVINDFHYGSLHNEIEPLLFCLTNKPVDTDVLKSVVGGWPHYYKYALIRIGEGDPRLIINFLREAWKKVSPNLPFEMNFLDQTIQSFYESEQKWGEVVNYASIFAIFVACLGMFGLSLASSQKRIKEIGIRKVFGASTTRIVLLISIELIMLVVLSTILAFPAAFYVCSEWLQNFAYRIDLTVFSFILSSLGVLFIAAITISFQILKAANSDPVDAIRYE